MDKLFEMGVIVLGGPFADRSGSLVIVAAVQVREMFRTDPWTEQDVLVVGDMKGWTTLSTRERSNLKRNGRTRMQVGFAHVQPQTPWPGSF